MQTESEKKIGLWNIVGLGLGGAIGTGIFVLLGSGIALSGRAIMPVVVVGCFFMLLAYWYQLAMPSIFVVKGGDYSMKAMFFGPVMAGFAACTVVLGAFALCSYAMALVDYAAIVFPIIGDYRTLAAFIVTTIFFLTTVKGSRFITILQNLVTIVLVVVLGLFIAFGVPKVDPSAFFANTESNPFFYGGLGGFLSAIAVMGWACQGTTMGPVSMGAVTKNPKKTIPQGIIIITILLSLIYGLMAYVAGGVLPLEEIAGQNISVTAEAIFPRSIYLFFVIGGGIGAIASSYLGTLCMYRYPLLRIAEDGWLPSVFKKQTKSGYPYVIYILFYLISIFPLLTGMSLDAVVSLVMIPTMMMNIYMNLSCLKIPTKYPEQWEKRSIRMPKWFWYVCCVLGTICAGCVAFNLFIGLRVSDAVVCVGLCLILLSVSIIRLKQGAVKKETLLANKEAIIREAITADAE